ncbi:MAG: DUF4115 domain-containing protein [Nitrospirae bacterium]|nr:DUF4115 domain-containing protein [Nitrospirota bacterium]MCL5977329.1 DUF4115 domain-containing protein [Nitrospirota bacterium]
MGVLKERREYLGRTIEEIAKATRIKGSYLRAIEEGDFSKLPVEVYTRGYIREYARFLGVSPDITIASYDAYIEETKGPKEADKIPFIKPLSEDVAAKDIEEYIAFHSEPESKEISDALEERPLLAKLPINGIARRALVALSVLIAVIVIYAVLPGGKDAPPVTPKIEPGIQPGMQIKEPESPPVVQSHKNAEEKSTQHVNPATIAPPSVPPANKPDTANPAKRKHNLSISATDTVWIQLTIDGDDKKEILLNAGETAFYEAYRSMNLVVGNAAGVKLKFNGKPLENLGEKGQVVRLDLPSTTPKKNEQTEKAVRPGSQPPQTVNPPSL